MRSSYIEINSTNLRNNINRIQELAQNKSIMAMVKANGYGHGMQICSKVFREEGVEYLGVAFVEEAISLRRAGDTGKICLTVPASIDEAQDLLKYNIETSIAEYKNLEVLSNIAISYSGKINAHLFINTGMNRDGIRPEDAIEFLETAKNYTGVNIIGIMTHLTSSEDSFNSFNEVQLSRFDELLKNIKSAGFDLQFIHSQNSGGIINYSTEKATLVRPGLSLYGYSTSSESAKDLGIKPVLTLKSKVIALNNVKIGDTTGYSMKYIATQNGTIATIPIGYGDGLLYSMTNNGKCLINGKVYPLVGSICMDEIMAFVGNDDIKIGDEVILIGKQGENEITVYDLAKENSSIVYDITTKLSDRLPRVLV